MNKNQLGCTKTCMPNTARELAVRYRFVMNVLRVLMCFLFALFVTIRLGGRMQSLTLLKHLEIGALATAIETSNL